MNDISQPQPRPQTPAVWYWQIVYCYVWASMFLMLDFVGILMLATADTTTSEIEPSELKLAGIVITVICTSLVLLFGSVPFGPKRPWNWVCHLILICIGLTICYCIPFCIPLLIFWVKPETRAFFNMRVTR
jgi:hypothetical protein